MTSARVTVVVATIGRGRAVVPTLRSALGAADELLVVASATEAARVRRIVEGSGVPARVLEAGDSLAEQRNAGAVAASHERIVIVDAGDLVSVEWLAAVRDAEGDAVLHPALAIAFGARFALWPQPQDAPRTRALAGAAVPWCGPLAAPARLLAAHPFPEVADELVDAGWQASTLAASVAHTVVPETVVFVRVWDARPLDRRPPGGAVAVLPELGAPAVAVLGGEAPRAARPRSVLARRAARATRAVLAPWKSGARRAISLVRRSAPEPWAVAPWRAANLLEPYIPWPGPAATGRAERWGGLPDAARVIARARDAVPRADYVFLAPWLQLGGGDTVLLRYLAAVRRLDPAAQVVLVTTEPVASTRLGEVPDGVQVIELRTLVDLDAHREPVVDVVLPQLIAAWGAHTVHAINTTVGFDVIERHGAELESTVFLSSFTIDRQPSGERTSVMFHRRPEFLDPVRAVLVDSRHYVDLMVREHGYERDKFVIQRHIIPPLPAAGERAEPYSAERPLRLLWAARFDVQKRLDILARIAERARAEGLPVRIEVFGEKVMGDPQLTRTLGALDAAGVVRRPPFARFAELPPSDYDAFIMTSEWEGVPNMLAEAMAAGMPVVAPLVGGIGELLDDAVGYPIPRFDDVDAYVDAIRGILADPAAARDRGAAARGLIEREMSQEAFDRRLRSVEGYLRPQAR